MSLLRNFWGPLPFTSWGHLRVERHTLGSKGLLFLGDRRFFKSQRIPSHWSFWNHSGQYNSHTWARPWTWVQHGPCSKKNSGVLVRTRCPLQGHMLPKGKPWLFFIPCLSSRTSYIIFRAQPQTTVASPLCINYKEFHSGDSRTLKQAWRPVLPCGSLVHGVGLPHSGPSPMPCTW